MKSSENTSVELRSSSTVSNTCVHFRLLGLNAPSHTLCALCAADEPLQPRVRPARRTGIRLIAAIARNRAADIMSLYPRLAMLFPAQLIHAFSDRSIIVNGSRARCAQGRPLPVVGVEFSSPCTRCSGVICIMTLTLWCRGQQASDLAACL